MDIYDKLGVTKIVNAWGTIIKVGGSIMPPESFAAAAEAGKSFVDMDELHRKAGAYIAELLGVEGAYISSGAAGGMVLAAAACLTGSDQDKIWALPETEGWRNEIVVQQLAGMESIDAKTLLADPRARPVIPRVYIDLEKSFALTDKEVCQHMREGESPIAIGGTDSGVRVDVMMLQEWELRAVARRLREVLTGKG